MENNFYYCINNNSSLGVIKKGTVVSTNQENSIINYIIYNAFETNDRAVELSITKEKGQIKYKMNKNDLLKLEHNCKKCYLYLIRNTNDIVDNNMLLTKDCSVVERIEITDIADRIKEIVNVNEQSTVMPVKIVKKNNSVKVSTIELLFYTKEKLLSIKNDIVKSIKNQQQNEKDDSVDYVFDSEDDFLHRYERQYIKIKNNKVR